MDNNFSVAKILNIIECLYEKYLYYVNRIRTPFYQLSKYERLPAKTLCKNKNLPKWKVSIEISRSAYFEEVNRDLCAIDLAKASFDLVRTLRKEQAISS